MNTNELTDRIYDTLMGNVGMSEHHVAFNPDDVTDQEVSASAGQIYMTIDGCTYLLQVTRVG